MEEEEEKRMLEIIEVKTYVDGMSAEEADKLLREKYGMTEKDFVRLREWNLNASHEERKKYNDYFPCHLGKLKNGLFALGYVNLGDYYDGGAVAGLRPSLRLGVLAVKIKQKRLGGD